MVGEMKDEQQNDAPSIIGSILNAVWGYEKSLWRWAALLGLIGGVLVAFIGGLFGYASYGYLGMIAGAVLGAILGWIVATLIFYVLVSTASYFS